MNAQCWALHNEKPYFGGTDGKVYEADYGSTDNSAFISCDLKSAFNYMGDRENLKQFHMAKPLVIADNDFNFLFNIDVDFEDRTITDTIMTNGTSGTAWDTGLWDASSWGDDNIVVNDWYGIAGIVRCAEIKLKGDFKNVNWFLSAINVL